MRKNRFEKKQSNPSSKFFKWSSAHETFVYYDKEKDEKFSCGDNFKFLILGIFITVKGWHNQSNGPIVCNEVKSINDELNVRSFKDGSQVPLAKGLWGEIKNNVKAAGGNYTFSVYAMDESGELINLAINKSAMINWIEFSKSNEELFFDTWVHFSGVSNSSNGAISFNYPEFKMGEKINETEEAMAVSCENKLSEYEDRYFNASDVNEKEEGVPAAQPSHIDFDTAFDENPSFSIGELKENKIKTPFD